MKSSLAVTAADEPHVDQYRIEIKERSHEIVASSYRRR